MSGERFCEVCGDPLPVDQFKGNFVCPDCDVSLDNLPDDLTGDDGEE